MRISPRKPGSAVPGVSGTLRVDRRTKALTTRLRRGDIAVIDDLDLDRATAERLVEAGVAAVVDASALISGRYPTLGPQVLADAGVVMLDGVGREVLGAVREGQRAQVAGDTLLVDDRPVATGRPLSPDDVATLMQEARSGIGTQLASFTHNTTEFLRREQDLLLHGLGAPETRTSMAGRPVVVVVKGYEYREDLRRLKRFIREQDPVLVGVDAGADALLAAGHKPDVVVVGPEGLGSAADGSSAQVSDKALKAAKDVVLHSDRGSRAVGGERLQRLGVTVRPFTAGGTTEDVALLMADLAEASIIVSVGSHATLDEFLDRQRTGLASTFLTRLRVGSRLVEARAVPVLYSGRVHAWHLLVVVLAALVALVAAVSVTPIGHGWIDHARDVLGVTALPGTGSTTDTALGGS